MSPDKREKIMPLRMAMFCMRTSKGSAWNPHGPTVDYHTVILRSACTAPLFSSTLKIICGNLAGLKRNALKAATKVYTD